MAIKIKKRKSPYQRHGKTPYKYSELYMQWRECLKRGDDAGARKFAHLHYDRFVWGLSPDRHELFGKIVAPATMGRVELKDAA